jgi:hypothetical protein
MGQLDFKLHVAPYSAMNSVESQIIFNGNRTDEWLKEKKPESERKCIIDRSRQENAKEQGTVVYINWPKNFLGIKCAKNKSLICFIGK